jgi:hypothetical protein
MSQLFFTQKIENGFAVFEEEEGRHLSTVLRKKTGDVLHLTDGKGFFYEAELADAGKRQVLARILSKTAAPLPRPGRLHIGIAPTKQMERLEWFLEKATEIGVDEITPLICQRSERDSLRLDRLEGAHFSHEAIAAGLAAQAECTDEISGFCKKNKRGAKTPRLVFRRGVASSEKYPLRTSGYGDRHWSRRRFFSGRDPDRPRKWISRREPRQSPLAHRNSRTPGSNCI